MNVLIVFVLVTIVSGQSHIRCQPSIGGFCGDNTRPREINCCDHGYCQPWSPTSYLCVEFPTKCPKQETDIDYYGNDLKTLSTVRPDQCCDACATTTGCVAYTFVTENAATHTGACYLKKDISNRVEKKGAVSGQLSIDLLPPSKCLVVQTDIDFAGNDLKSVSSITLGQCCEACANTPNCAAYSYVAKGWDGNRICYLKSSAAGSVAKLGVVSAQLKDVGCTNPLYAPCGASSCCPDGSFCQPWNPWYSQCIPKPPINKCPTILTNVDFYGGDLEVRYNLLPATCCEACFNHPECHLFTFVNYNSDGHSACYLKKTLNEQRVKVGAVSGYKIKV